MEVGMDNDNQVTNNTSVTAQANINLWQHLKSESNYKWHLLNFLDIQGKIYDYLAPECCPS